MVNLSRAKDAAQALALRRLNAAADDEDTRALPREWCGAAPAFAEREGPLGEYLPDLERTGDQTGAELAGIRVRLPLGRPGSPADLSTGSVP
jgi:hypothetical protein